MWHVYLHLIITFSQLTVVKHALLYFRAAFGGHDREKRVSYKGTMNVVLTISMLLHRISHSSLTPPPKCFSSAYRALNEGVHGMNGECWDGAVRKKRIPGFLEVFHGRVRNTVLLQTSQVALNIIHHLLVSSCESGRHQMCLPDSQEGGL